MTNYFFTVFLLFGKILLSIRKEFKMQISKMSPAVSFKGCLQYRNIINDMTQKYEQEIRNINLFNTQDENQKIINFASVKLREYLSKNYPRSEEHTSELQSPDQLVCRLLLEKKK